MWIHCLLASITSETSSLNHCCLLCNMLLFSAPFQDGLSTLGFQKFDSNVPKHGFLSFKLLEARRAFFPQVWGFFGHYVFKYFFSCPIPLSFPSRTLCMLVLSIVRPFLWAPSFFSVFFRLDVLYWSLFRFTDSFLCFLHSVKPIQLIF